MSHRLPPAAGNNPAAGATLPLDPPAPSQQEADLWLRRAEREADLLYATVRSLVLAVFWALYLLSEDGHHHYGIAGTTLIAYTGLAAFTWYAVWRGWQGRLLAGLTVTADVVLVVAQLALLSDAAGRPPGHVFTLPPAALVFLIVAHTALRFRTTLVLYAGVTSAALLLIIGALPTGIGDAEPPSPHYHAPIYWQVLPLVVLLLTTVVLWFVARRTRALLDTAIAQTRRAGRLARFFSPAVARHLAEEGVNGPLQGSWHNGAVLFFDIRGFTAMAERMRPVDLGPFLGEFRGLVTRCVFACGGTIDKFIGDGALAVFGALQSRPDAAVCALNCANSVLAAVEVWSARRVAQGLPPVHVAIGAHYGEIFAGIVSCEEMMEFTVLGDTVNVAERLQRSAANGEASLVVSDAFRHACGDAFPDEAFTSLGALLLPGRVDRVDALSLRERRSSAVANGSRCNVPGRVSEEPA